MSRPAVPDPEALRGRLEHALRFDIEHEGSLYLNALACVYLAAPEASEPALVGAFNLQAEAEHVDADQVLQDLLAVLT